jgi:hypothetical protein
MRLVLSDNRWLRRSIYSLITELNINIFTFYLKAKYFFDIKLLISFLFNLLTSFTRRFHFYHKKCVIVPYFWTKKLYPGDIIKKKLCYISLEKNKTKYQFNIVCLENKVQIYSVMVMVFNANFNDIAVISWRSALLLEETGENHRPVASHWHFIT